MNTTTLNLPLRLFSSNFHHSPPPFRKIYFPLKGLEFYKHGRKINPSSSIRSVDGDESVYLSAWDENPYETLLGGDRAYLDEQDIVTFLDPPKELIPFDPASYNPAAYLWKKIDDIPRERHHRLLKLLKPRLISRAWEIAGTRYEDPKLAKISEFNLLSNEDSRVTLECYNCRKSGGESKSSGRRKGPMPIAWINFFKKAMFVCKDGNIYGRFMSGSILERLVGNLSPLYFIVRNIKEVMSTEQPCDFAYEFGDGLFDLHEYPQGFPRPVKHPYPFDDQVVVYVRRLGPGVSIGQAWQEGKALEQVPQKLCGEILMVKDYSAA